MKIAQNIFKTTLLSAILLLSFGEKTYANSLTPPINEVFLSQGSRETYTVNIKNEEKKKISVTPVIYPYSAEDESLINGDEYIFVRADIEEFEIKPTETISIRYEIIPPQNLQPGTYFNLIVFEENIQKSVLNETNPVKTTANLSQLVVLHITDSANVKGITSDFGNLNIEILDNGIPFIKPTKIKYSLQNTTNYVLEPDGEIQVFSTGDKYEPIYIKINKAENKLYPNDILEEEVNIDTWNIRDIIYPRKIIGRIYNGLDSNYKTAEVITESYTLYLVGAGGFIILIGMFFKSLYNDNKKEKITDQV